MLNATQGFTYNKFEKPNDWPQLDKTFDYKIENGKLLSGNEHIYLSGPVTYTKVGNPTIKDNIVSGFSGSDYMSIGTFAPTTPWEAVFRVKTPSSNSSKYFLGSLGYGLVVGTSTSGQKVVMKLFCSSNGTSWDIANISATGQLELNTFYYIRFGFSGTQYYIDHSLDGIEYSGRNTANSTANIISSSLLIGIAYQTSYYWSNEIDLNESYIKVNDNLWFYGKTYTTKDRVAVPAGLEYNNTTTPSIGWVNTNTDRVKGPVNYTVVGSPTIVDGVVSGFSKDDYVKLTQKISIAENENFEMMFKVHTPSDEMTKNEHRCFFSFGYDGVGYDEGAYWFRRNKDELEYSFYFSFYNLTSVWTDLNFDRNTDYYIKINRTNGNYVCVYRSTDKINWQLCSENTSSIAYSPSLYFPTIGKNLVSINAQTPFTGGSIDLNETYITVNGQAWFGNCPSEFQQFIPVPQGTMIGKDETEMLQVETYQDKGVAEYIKVGNPTISDAGIVSDFSASDYIVTSQVLETGQQDTFEFKTKFVKTAAGSLPLFLNTGRFVCSGASGQPPYIALRNSGENQTSYGAWADFKGTAAEAFAYNTPYWVKMGHDGSYIYLDVSTDGTNYTNWISVPTKVSSGAAADWVAPTVTGSPQTALGFAPTSYYLHGTMDLNETSITLNGSYWFHPYFNSYPKLVGPVNYEVEGSPTIVDGVASNFSSTNYLECPALPSSITSFEHQLKFTTGDSAPASDSYWGLSGYGTSRAGFFITSDNKLGVHFIDFSQNTRRDYTSDYVLSNNSTYWVKWNFLNGVATLYYSADGQNWDSETLPASSSSAGTYTAFHFGKTSSGSFNGSIDLNQTYIKVNGALWFGKEDWTPSTYTDNAIYLLGSHKADYSNYNQLSLTPSIETESDEVGSYNVWIDNQKVIKNKTGNTLLEWDKLALTTGYSVTIPSSLKAHPIKIEPTNSTDSIIAFNTETIEESDESI